jgi:uncharacterized protein YbaR (Trm112 family)
MQMDMRKDLLEILACPRCRGQLEALGSPHVLEGLCCRACAVVYPVREGIPVMLVEEALPLDAWRPGSNPA